MRRLLKILVISFLANLLIISNQAIAFDPSVNIEDFNTKITELHKSGFNQVYSEFQRTGTKELSWVEPNVPSFKPGEPETNLKSLNVYALAVQLIVKDLLTKLNPLPTVNGGVLSPSNNESLTESQFIQNLTSYARDYYEKSKNLIIKKSLNANFQNYYGYKKNFIYPEFPTFTGDFKLDTASLSNYRNSIIAVMKNFDETFDSKLIVTSDILDNKESYSNNSFEGFLIRLTDLRGKYGMKFQSELDKRNFDCKTNYSCGYNYSSAMPSGGLYSFDPGSPEEREKEFRNQEKLFQIWLDNEIKNISVSRYSQTPYSDEAKANNCKIQTNATKKNLDSYESTFNSIRSLISQQYSNPDTNERSSEFQDYSKTISQISIGLSIWQEKLPIYFDRDMNCIQYKELLEKTNELVAISNELLTAIKAGKINSLSTNNQVFNQKNYDIESSKVDKAVKSIISSIPKKTVVCMKGKITKKVTALEPKCPAGYKLL
jgi:hypothetical protein